MKKLLTLLSMIGAFLTQSNAQITITRSDFGMIGDSVIYAYDSTLNNLSVGASGTNKTWNFTTGVSADYHEISFFKDPSTVIGSPAEANLAIEQGVDDASFFNIDSARVQTIIPLNDYGMDNQVITITNFPLNYGDVIKDSSYTQTQGTPADFGFSGLQFDSIRITVNVHTTSTVDGWGSLVIPSGTHNTLRVRNVTDVDVTVEGKFIIWTTLPVDLDQHQVLFAWYANNKKYSMAEAYLDSNGVVSAFRYQVDSIPTKPTTGIAAVNGNTTVSVYPNPANESVSFNTDGSEGELRVMDITGKTILSRAISSTVETIDTHTMPAGVYFLNINRPDGRTLVSKFIVQH